jgi:exosortase A-associated hydrolase 2
MTSMPKIDAHAFFLPAAGGGRYCMYYPVPPDVTLQGALLLIPPFGEELNRTRRLAAQQARLLASLGFAVLQIDLFGCGDSAGELRDARWETWLDDLETAHAWISTETRQFPVLWAVRLGALLALDLAVRLEYPPSRLLLWAPVTSGLLFARQFLRQHVAGQMLNDKTEPQEDTAALRRRLADGEAIEVAGYEFTTELMEAIESRSAVSTIPRCRQIDWFDINAHPGQSIPIATRQLIDGWTAAHIGVRYLQVQSPQFWSIQDAAECPELLRATYAALVNAEA